MALTLLGNTQRRTLAMVPAVLVLVVGWLAYQSANTVIDDVREVERSHAIVEGSEALLTRAVDAETGQRAYLLAGNETFLQPYHGARGDISRWLDSLRVLVQSDRAQSRRLDAMAAVISERFALLDSGIAQKKRESQEASSEARLLAGKRKMDELRTIVASLHAQERQALNRRHAVEQRGVRNAAIAVGSSAVIALLLSALVNLFFSRVLKEREQANVELAELNRDLEHQSEQLEMQAVEMESQSAELEATAEDLKSTNEALGREQQAATLLSDASRILASTLDYEKTLNAVAKLAVGRIADWCGVDLVEPNGDIRQVVVAHKDEEKVRWAKDLNKLYPPDYASSTGVGNVIRTGIPQIYPSIADEMLVAAARDEGHLTIMRQLQIRSVMIVPMIARGRTLGALTLIISDLSHHYTEADQAQVMELATRAALAIDNAQLYRAAVAASETRSAFLATMSHELRTPLNAIIGYQSLLAEGIEGKLNSGQRAQLSRIRASADHLLGLIDEILTFSRLDAGKETLQREELDLSSLVAAAVTMVAPLAEAKGIKLRDETSDARLVTDGGKVRQILLNLLSNAIKFSDSGEIVVSSQRDGSTVTVSVADDGIGIAPENLENVFDPFWQVEQRSTRRAGGTGLGLSVSRNLARLLGGEVTVQSSLNEGSTFNLVLPVLPISG